MEDKNLLNRGVGKQTAYYAESHVFHYEGPILPAGTLPVELLVNCKRAVSNLIITLPAKLAGSDLSFGTDTFNKRSLPAFGLCSILKYPFSNIFQLASEFLAASRYSGPDRSHVDLQRVGDLLIAHALDVT